MAKAAELNHVTRPAISLAIQKLEDEMGAQLVVHKQRSFELTSKGIILLKKSEPLFTQVEELRNDLRSSKEIVAGDFRIGATRTLASFSLPQVMKKLKHLYPSVDYTIHLGGSPILVEKLEKKEIDLAYLIGDESHSDYKNVTVSRGHYCLIKPKEAGENEIEYAITERRPETERLKVLFERQFNKDLPIFSSIHSWDVIWSWVNKGVCGGLVPDFLLTSKTGIKNYSVVMPKVFPYEIKAMFPKSKINHPVIKSFLETI
jgi:DNA-binding transcriptional LysR family regulator